MRRIIAFMMGVMLVLGCAEGLAAQDTDSSATKWNPSKQKYQTAVSDSSDDETEDSSSSEGETEEQVNESDEGPSVTPASNATAPGGKGAFPALNAQGFYDDGEFIYEDPENGIWRYASSTLKVEIIRKTQSKPKLIWYEAEIWSTEDNVFRMIPDDSDKRMTSLEWPYKIAQKNGTVFALNSDYAHLRYKKKNNKVGILVRDGKVIWDRTMPKNKGGFPNLDTLALFPDGDMQVYYSNELKAKEYVDMGAVDVLAFGPWLIRDGKLNAAGVKKYGPSWAPRTAIGMFEKGHYLGILIEGRHSGSKGASVEIIAKLMQQRGVQVAFNLDGGQTATILFMGKQICKIGGSVGRNASARRTAEILGIGESGQVQEAGIK